MDNQWMQRGRRLWQSAAIAIIALCTLLVALCLHTMFGMLTSDLSDALTRDPAGTLSFLAASILPGLSMLTAVIGRIVCLSIPSVPFVLLMAGGASGYFVFMLQLFR